MAKRLVLSVLVFLAVFAVACGGAAPTTLPEATATSAPTPDIPATVAAEVEAALAAAANAESTATPAPDLQEAQPTATPLPQSSAGNLPPSSILPTSVAAVQLVPGSALLVEGETKQLESLVAGGAGNQLNGRPVAWASSNSAIARISGTGLVTGALAGLTNVTAIVEGVAAAAIIEVRHGPVASLEIALGNGAQLIATLQDAAGHPLQDRVVTWSSNRPDVLQVDPGSGALAVGPLEQPP